MLINDQAQVYKKYDTIFKTWDIEVHYSLNEQIQIYKGSDMIFWNMKHWNKLFTKPQTQNM